MKKIKFNLILLILSAVIFGCSDNTVNNTVTETLVYQLDGIIENIGGDCSAVQVRTRELDTLDFTGANKIRFSLSGMSDADLSSICIYYLNGNGENINLFNLTDRDQINNTNSIEVDSPGLNTVIFSRVTLRSSVCTGQIYHLTFSDLKIYKK